MLTLFLKLRNCIHKCSCHVGEAEVVDVREGSTVAFTHTMGRLIGSARM